MSCYFQGKVSNERPGDTENPTRSLNAGYSGTDAERSSRRSRVSLSNSPPTVGISPCDTIVYYCTHIYSYQCFIQAFEERCSP